MTQQYLLGEFSLLLADFESLAERERDAIHSLRREVERSPAVLLPSLTQEALGLADAICLSALEQGDGDNFYRSASAAAALRDFAVAAQALT